eukprot:2681593-Pleurochrysis_carterae.AAC.2
MRPSETGMENKAQHGHSRRLLSISLHLRSISRQARLRLVRVLAEPVEVGAAINHAHLRGVAVEKSVFGTTHSVLETCT